MAELLGFEFDWGGAPDQADQLKTPAEQSGSLLGWVQGRAQEAAGVATTAAQAAGVSFAKSQLAGLVQGPEVFGLDLLEASSGSSSIPVQLTAAGKKWLAIGAGALVVFWLMGRR